MRELNLPASLYGALQAGLTNETHLSKKETNARTIEENLILNVLKEEALYIDKIVEKTKLNISTTASTLTILEMKGKIRNLGGNIYALHR